MQITPTKQGYDSVSDTLHGCYVSARYTVRSICVIFANDLSCRRQRIPHKSKLMFYLTLHITSL